MESCLFLFHVTFIGQRSIKQRGGKKQENHNLVNHTYDGTINSSELAQQHKNCAEEEFNGEILIKMEKGELDIIIRDIGKSDLLL